MDQLLKLTFFLSLILGISSTDVSFNENTPRPIYDINGLLQKTLTNLEIIQSDNYAAPNISSENIFQEISNIANLHLNFSKCSQDLIFVAENLLKKTWAQQMLDSYGKPESGILMGNGHWVGDYTECINVYAPPATNDSDSKGNFHGQYCSLSYSMGNSSNTAGAIPGFGINLGVCLPDSCSASQFFPEVPQNETGHNQTNSSSPFKFQCQQRERHMSGAAKGVIALMAFFCALVAIGSFYTVVKYFMEVFENENKPSLVVNVIPNDSTGILRNEQTYDKESDDLFLLTNTTSGKFQGFMKKYEPFLECFSIFKNGAKLLNTEAGEGELLCIHGIRFLSMSWVILGHTYLFGFAEIRAILGIFDQVKNWPFQIVLQGFYSVDSFFVLSGFLLSFLCLQQFVKNQGRINWPYFYIHRYLRLTPIYMVVLGFYATVFVYLGSGPFWPQNDMDPNCKNYWWWNLLYINNFSNQMDECMGWAWYLANDMQFFIISPFILICLWRWPKVGFSIMAALILACWASNFYLTYHYDMVVGMANILSVPPNSDTLKIMAKFQEFFDKIYIKPYTRIAPYVIGILTGYLVHLRRQNNSSKHSLVFLSIGWIVATTITLACTYGLYHQNPGLVAKSIYNALSRTTWAIGLSWVIYVCLVNQGGVVNSILSYKLFIPLSRLTYTAYLIHPLVINSYFFTLKSTFDYTHPTLVLLFLGIMVVTYGLSLPIALVFESPLIALEKVIRKSLSKKT